MFFFASNKLAATKNVKCVGKRGLYTSSRNGFKQLVQSSTTIGERCNAQFGLLNDQFRGVAAGALDVYSALITFSI